MDRLDGHPCTRDIASRVSGLPNDLWLPLPLLHGEDEVHARDQRMGGLHNPKVDLRQLQLEIHPDQLVDAKVTMATRLA